MILDRTHLCFFTSKTARRLPEENGYWILRGRRNGYADRAVAAAPFDQVWRPRAGSDDRNVARFLGYQIALMAQKA